MNNMAVTKQLKNIGRGDSVLSVSRQSAGSHKKESDPSCTTFSQSIKDLFRKENLKRIATGALFIVLYKLQTV
jgi:hypothetical protein